MSLKKNKKTKKTRYHFVHQAMENSSKCEKRQKGTDSPIINFFYDTIYFYNK